MRTLVFDSQINWMRAAVIENGLLCEMHMSRANDTDPTESLYLGVVEQIRPSLCAAFVDIGLEQNAFLPIQEGEQIRCGDEIIVQGAAKQAVDSKGLRVTRRINLSGKSIVLIPGETGVHISKKIKDAEHRALLFDAGCSVCPEGYGLIVRTASLDLTEQMMRNEAQTLCSRWENARLKARGMKAPGLVWAHPALDEQMIRDLSGRDLNRIVTNQKKQYERLLIWQDAGFILQQTDIELHDEMRRGLVFDAFGAEAQLDKALKKRVWLPGGGYLIIDSCEAMTVIDVNSGKMSIGKGIEETALQVNMEAAVEIARQIRLRNTGGMIVIDFIDMKLPQNRDKVQERLSASVSGDTSKVEVHGFTRLGLMELTRRREKAELRKQMRVSCSYCSGAGELLSGEAVAVKALQQIRRLSSAGQRGPFLVRCAKAAADALTSMINPLEEADIYVLPSGMHAERTEIEQISCGAKGPDGAFALCRRKDI